MLPACHAFRCAAMRYRPPPHVTFCVADGTVVVLDLKADRYLALAGALGREFRAIVDADRMQAPDEACIERLGGMGLIEPDREGRGLAPVSARQPDLAVIDQMHVSHVSLRLIASMTLSFVRAWLWLKRWPIEAIIEALRDRKRRLPVGRSDAAELASTVAACRHLVPATPVCLIDSLALIDFLLRHGACAELVIGVRMAPFRAHCWVQVENRLLNDTLDHVRPFTPILVA